MVRPAAPPESPGSPARHDLSSAKVAESSVVAKFVAAQYGRIDQASNWGSKDGKPLSLPCIIFRAFSGGFMVLSELASFIRILMH